MTTFPVLRRTGLILLALLLAALILWLSGAGQPRLEHLPAATLAIPDGKPARHVLVLASASQQLDDRQLLELAGDNQARVLQLVLTVQPCEQWPRQMEKAIHRLGQTPDLVAGVEAGAARAWRWLASQTSDQAEALSVGFALQQPDCSGQPLPERAAHGHWLTAWNENPDPDTARFVREQPRTENVIGYYGTPLARVLFAQLKRALQGQADPVPVVEEPASPSTGVVTIFYSGDGGWRDLDRDSAEYMARQGYPVVGVDALRYFWQHKSAEQVTSDLEQLMATYRQKWNASAFVLAGYSFGANLLPEVYNRLPARDQQQIKALLLLAPERSGSLEIEVQGWLGGTGQEIRLAPELVKVPMDKLFCIYGSEEAEESGCTLAEARMEKLQLPGGHHFDEDYPKLAQRMLDAIRQRLH